MALEERSEKSKAKIVTFLLTVVFILAAGTAVGVFARHAHGHAFNGMFGADAANGTGPAANGVAAQDAASGAAKESSGATPATALLVLNKSSNELAIVDPTTKQVVARIATGNGPHEVAASDDGKMAFVTNYGDPRRQPGNTLSVYDLVAQKEIHRVDVSPLRAPHGIYFSEGKVYFTAEINKAIARYDPATNSVDWVLGIGQDRTHMVLRTKFLNEFFTTNVNSGSVTAITKSSEESGWTETNIPVGRGDEGIDITPDDKEVWVANADDQTLSAISVATSKVVATFKSGARHANRVKFTLDGKHALVSDLGGDDVSVIDVATRQIVKTIVVGQSPAGILMRPDGNVAYVALSGADGLAVIDLAKMDVVDTVATGGGPDGMAWAVRK